MFYWTQFIKNIISTTNQYKNYWYLYIFIQNLWNPMCILHLEHISIQKLNSLEILNLCLDFIGLTVGKVDSHIQVVLNISSVQFSHSVMSNSSWPHGLQHARLPSPSLTPRAHSNSCPLCQWCHPTSSSSVIPFSAFNLSQHQGLFERVSSLHQVAKVLEFQLQHQSFQWIFRTDFL